MTATKKSTSRKSKLATKAQPRKGAKTPPKADRLIQMLRRAKGASIEELVAEFGTLPHSIRAQISIQKRKRGLNVELTGGRYRTTLA